MISLCVYLEKKQDGEWVGDEIDNLNPDLYQYLIGTHDLFSFFGRKYGKGYEHYPTFPFITSLPLATEESIDNCQFKDKYTEDKYRDIYKNIRTYDTSEAFAIYFDDETDRSYGMFTIEDALNFDYNQHAVNGDSYKDLLCDTFYDLLIYAQQNKYERILFYFC